MIFEEKVLLNKIGLLKNGKIIICEIKIKDKDIGKKIIVTDINDINTTIANINISLYLNINYQFKMYEIKGYINSRTGIPLNLFVNDNIYKKRKLFLEFSKIESIHKLSMYSYLKKS